MGNSLKTVLCFGSLGFEGDNTPFKVCEELKGKISGVRMLKCDSPLDVLDFISTGNLYIIDSVRGLENVSLFTSLKDFKKAKSITAHDLDLGLYLSVLEEMEKIKKLKIIGIPLEGEKEAVVREVRKLLSSKQG